MNYKQHFVYDCFNFLLFIIKSYIYMQDFE